MKQNITIKATLLLSLLLFCQYSFSQGITAERQNLPNTDTTILEATGFDYLDSLIGDDTPKPYYTFLWVYGDGTFTNGTQDSTIKHIYQNIRNRTFIQSGALFSKVYPTGNYGGTTRPPSGLVAPGPGNPFRPPAALQSEIPFFNIIVKDPPVAESDSMFEAGNLIQLQLNHDVQPEDTLVNIISFRSLIPNDTIVEGRVYLFYNSKTKPATVPNRIKGVFGNGVQAAPPPSTQYGKFNFQETLNFYRDISENGEIDLTSNNPNPAFDSYQNCLVFRYDSLAGNNLDLRNLFVEFENDTAMWNMFQGEAGDTMSFLAVITAMPQVTDDGLLAAIKVLQDGLDLRPLDSLGLRNILNGFYGDDNEWLPITPNSNFRQEIIGFSEVSSPIVKSHDPNEVKVYACECPSQGQQKVVCVVNFENTGRASTQLVNIKMEIPEQLVIESIEPISYTIGSSNWPSLFQPTDAGGRLREWNFPNASLKAGEVVGKGHPSTQGQMIFSILVDPAFNINDIEAISSCIVFDLEVPICTVPVKPADYITTIDNEGVKEKLECVSCKTTTTPETCFGLPCWLCYAICILLILLVLYWIVKKLF